MKNEFSVERLAVAAFAQAQGSLAGSVPLAQLDRLAQESKGDSSAVPVEYRMNADMRLDAAGVNEPWLHLSASTHLTMVCQRCLGDVDVEVAFERDFRFVATEELAEVEDEESEEDVLVLSKAYNGLELLTDELLLAMPLVPMHGACPRDVKLQVQDPEFVAAMPEKANPFAVLQKLKKDSG
jgi:uncharacterized protein